MKTLTLAAIMAFAVTGAASAQDMMHGAAPDLPEICLMQSTMDHGAMGGGMGGGMAMEPDADKPHADLMAGMDQMNADMMAGATAEDIDVAFVCSMIPHHRGAVSMAKAELAHGDDDFAKTLAGQIVAAQEQEIADMLAWLEKQK
ncbi:MAG: DUF305 domain-containing protein [Hyphomicrobiales bacterium]|nr:MAG: DUF305 domain-containing protein [Hyphomicrobiales bacterium]